MFKTLRSRLWLGYALLTLFVLGALILGLFYTLNQTSALFRQTELQMRLEEQTLLQAIENEPEQLVETIQASLANRPTATANLRVFILDAKTNVVFDSQGPDASMIDWKSLAGIRRTETQNSSLVIRDAKKEAWIYIGHRLPLTKQFLVIAAPRGNLTLKFMMSDPMVRMTTRVLFFAIIVSFLLSLLMDRWLAEPIRRISRSAQTLALIKQQPLPLEGPDEIKELAISLNEMSRKVNESRQSQRDFISDVSHELKTPLTSIQGFANAILDGTAGDKNAIQHAAEVISEESDRLLRLVVDLLTLARFEGGVRKLELEPSDIDDLITRVVDKMTPIAKQNQIHIEFSRGALPVVNLDGDCITQVLTNLLENAIKYSSANKKIFITTSYSTSSIRVEIEDQGIGIELADLTRVFDRFYQVEKSRKSGKGGSSGLGLPIAREIVKAHGGELLVKSEPGNGSCFSVVLPRTIV